MVSSNGKTSINYFLLTMRLLTIQKPCFFYRFTQTSLWAEWVWQHYRVAVGTSCRTLNIHENVTY